MAVLGARDAQGRGAAILRKNGRKQTSKGQLRIAGYSYLGELRIEDVSSPLTRNRGLLSLADVCTEPGTVEGLEG